MMSAVSDNSQVNFNPAWMQPQRAVRLDHHRSSGGEMDDAKGDSSIPPILAKNRYSREEMLLLNPTTMSKPPDGLGACPFFVPDVQAPIILSPFSETELRVQNNINSSKALSYLNHQERTAINNGNPWIPAGERGTARPSKPSNRWSALASDSTGMSSYVKPAANRGGGAGTTGRGGGAVGRGGGRTSTTDAGKVGFASRSRYKSGSEEDPNSGWTVVGGAKTGGNGASGGGVTTPGTEHVVNDNVWRGKEHETAASGGVFGRQDSSGSALGGGGVPEAVANAGNRFSSGDSENNGFGRSAARVGSSGNRNSQAQPPASPIGHFNISDFKPNPDTGSTTPSIQSTGWGVPSPAQPGADWVSSQPQHSPITHATAAASAWGASAQPPSSPAIPGSDWTTSGAVINNGALSGSRPQQQQQQPPPSPPMLDADELDKMKKAVESLTMSHSPPVSNADVYRQSPIVEFDKWFYYDPKGEIHGPYEAEQMNVWYNSGFFTDDLRCRAASDSVYATTLGELLNQYGREKPFSRRVAPPAPQQPQMPSMDQRGMFERLMLEEQRRLLEQREQLKRDEESRLMFERQLQLKAQELAKKEEDLRLASRQRELELEQKQKELQRQAEEEAQRKVAELKAFELAEARRLQEEAEREKARLEDERRQALEAIRQREAQLAAEEELRAKQRERERLEQERLLKEQEHLRKQHAAELELQKRHVEAARLAQAQREAAAAAAHAQTQAQAQQRQNLQPSPPTRTAVSAPWAPAAAAVSQTKPVLSLAEIQAEEQRRDEERQRKEAEALAEQRKLQAQRPSSVWSGTTISSTIVNKSVWGTPPNTGNSSPALKRAVPPAASSQWPAIPTAPANAAPPTKAAVAPLSKSAPSSSGTDDGRNKLTKWVVRAINNLNKSLETNVDAEPFAMFIADVVNPDEVGDYFITYFGESAQVKELHREYLEKRIELRPKQQTAKDDLSAAQAASNAAFQQVASKKKQKKNKGKASKVDANVLGFKPGADPNRFNVGEIDNTPPVNLKKKR